MERLLCFIIFGLIVALAPMAENAPTEDEIVRCFQTMTEKSELECCPETVFDYVEIQESPCEKLNGTCDEATCLFKTIGIIKDGSTINQDEAMTLLTLLAKDKPASKEMAERVLRYCFGEERYIIYFEDPEDNNCGAMQLAFCSYVNSLIACTDTTHWKQTQECKEYLPKVKTCARSIYEDIDAVKVEKEKKE